MQEIKLSNLHPIYSPRSNMNKYIEDVQNYKTNLIINIDKEILSLFKNQFQENDNALNLQQFISFAKNNLKSWQKDLPNRQSRLIKYLTCIFDQIQNKRDGKAQWQHFNNSIIEKALNLKSLQSQQNTMISMLKPTSWSSGKSKFQTPIQKVISIPNLNKLACLCQQSNVIQFFSLSSNQHYFKPLVLEKQELIVQKHLNRRVKEKSENQHSLTVKQNYKKEVVVADYKIIFLNMLYIHSSKYNMLLTSSSDGMVRGWNISGANPVLAKQPENEDQKMIHNFPVQIHCMAWDQVNQILYCSGKNAKVYLWLIKTDSERQLYDTGAHGDMISSMIMMPKLQFLATGGFDGKLILWDTISLTKKFKYEEHTRSIVSMTFHEGLILLFTAAYDHSICVWNPYIPSLIYKIPCNINVIQVQIIPNTSFIAALDVSSNLKIRQINKFNLISSYVVDRPEEVANKPQSDEKNVSAKIQPTCMNIMEEPDRFFFAGNLIKCVDFDPYQALATSDYYPTHLLYIKEKMQLFVTLKNNIQIWDILTGRIVDTFTRQTENQISAIDLIENSSQFIVGDVSGSVFLRKVENGIKVSKIYQTKYKNNITHLLSKNGGLWNQSVIFIGCQDGEIIVFGKDESHDYLHLRTLNPKRVESNLSIEVMEYEAKRNILMIGSNSGNILFMDVDKNKVTNIFKTQNGQIQRIVLKIDIPMLVAFSKKYDIFGVYLPPHSKKFKGSCHLYGEYKQTISSLVSSKITNRYYVGFENGNIQRINIPENILHGTNETTMIYSQWKVTLNQSIKDMILIQNQTILVVIQHLKSITFIEVQTGQILNQLNSEGKAQHNRNQPLCFFKNDSKELYIPQEKKYVKISKQLQKEDAMVNFHHNPHFLYDIYRQKATKNIKKRSNPGWKVFPNFEEKVQQNIQNIKKIQRSLEKFEEIPKKRRLRQVEYQSVQEKKDHINKAIQVQKKWQKSKEQDDVMTKTKTKKLFSQSFYKTQLLKNKKHEQQAIKHKSMHKNESSPMIRLGFALQRIDEKDKKAMKFIQMGEKKLVESKTHIRLPKLK